MSVEQSEQQVPVTPAPEVPVAGPAAPQPPVQQPAAPAPEPGDLVAAPPRTEEERLDPQPTELRLESGLPFALQPLKLRQFLRLLRIVTRGASDVLDAGSLNFDDPDSFAQTFGGMVIFSIPEAEDEAVDFVKSICQPVGLTFNVDKDGPKWDALYMELDNPELDDFITIVEALIHREAEDLRALGKRLMRMFQTAQKAGALGKNSHVTV